MSSISLSHSEIQQIGKPDPDSSSTLDSTNISVIALQQTPMSDTQSKDSNGPEKEAEKRQTSATKNYRKNPYEELSKLRNMSFIAALLFPIIGILSFLALWHIGASQIETSLGTLPGPTQVWSQFTGLIQEHKDEQAKEVAFYERQEVRNLKKLEKDPNASVKIRPYTGSPTFFDQILTSLVTVMTGLMLASLIAIPLGIVCGMSSKFYAALNPLIQVFKPVSPLAWLPLVTIIVSALVVTNDPALPKSFIISAVTVTLCCLWPTVINTTIGVSQIDND